jgi:transposase
MMPDPRATCCKRPRYEGNSRGSCGDIKKTTFAESLPAHLTRNALEAMVRSQSTGVTLPEFQWAQAVGRSRGGRASKIHCLADDCGRPIAFALTPGNVADISMAVPLLGAVALSNRLIADEAYYAYSLRNCLKIRRIEAVIRSTVTQAIPYSLDRAVYRRRNLIEHLFCRLKNWRRLATRYGRLARNYLTALAPVAVVTEWTSMSPLPRPWTHKRAALSA